MSKVPAADATLGILSFLGAQRGPVAAQTIANALALPRSSTYHLLAVMVERGYVLYLPEERRYGLGSVAFELASAFTRQQPLTRLGAPLLAHLVDAVRESAHLSVLRGTDVLYLIEERAPHRPSLVTDVGVRLPAHLTASGRAQLAALPPAQLRALYADKSVFAERAARTSEPSSYRALRSLLDTLRGQGYSVELGEITPGFASIGVVVRDHLGWPAAGIAVTFPLTDTNLSARDAQAEVRAFADRVLPELNTMANELGRRIHGTR